MGTCSSSNTGTIDIDAIKEVKEASPEIDVQNTKVDLNTNLGKESSSMEAPVLKLLDGHYNLIFGPDPNSVMFKVDGDKLWIIGQQDEEPDRALKILEYGKGDNCENQM